MANLVSLEMELVTPVSFARPQRAFARVALRPWLALFLFCVSLLSARPAHAYPWMIRHGYTACATCHVDPSGAGVLTEYGSAQGDALLRMHYGPDSGNGDAPKSAGFLWGAVQPPKWFIPSGAVRTLIADSKTGNGAFATDLIVMQADLRAAIVSGGFRAYASVGFVNTDGSAASLTGPIVSRQHWLGWAFGKDDAFLVRAGRIDVPFGIRSIEHTLFVRRRTRTDLNDTQEHGVALAYNSGMFRAELMGIAGNYQISPDAYRERGYSGYAELAPAPNAAFGVSSLVTHAKRDVFVYLPNTRQAHGVFGRWAPVAPIVLMAEADLVLQSATSSTGYATMLQADVEPVQGLHFIATGENMRVGGTSTGTSWSGWLGAGWFFAPHADVRFDFQKQSLAFGDSKLATTALMLQFHVYL
ncbi:MAG: hypothetical protein ABUL62_09450 [Myxococcales bacterium]